MGKVVKVGGRGTSRRITEEDNQKWAGDAYRKQQADKKKQSANRMVHTGRGTGSKKLGDIPDPKKRPSTEGMTRVTGRGTGSRKSRNKGN